MKGKHTEQEIEEMRKQIKFLEEKINLDLHGKIQLQQYIKIVSEYDRANRLQS
jgi:hypothetical protein